MKFLYYQITILFQFFLIINMKIGNKLSSESTSEKFFNDFKLNLISNEGVKNYESIKLKKFKIDQNTLPSTGAKYFMPMRVNYKLVNEEIETSKKPSLMSKEKFEIFFKNVIEPVDKYIKKFINVYRFDIKSNSKCFTTVADKSGQQYKFKINMDDYLKDYDYVFFIFFIKQDGLNASASTINMTSVLKDGYLRPACGVININFDNFSDVTKFNELEMKEARRTFFHEITHAFVFMPKLHPFFINEKGEKMKYDDIVQVVELPNKSRRPSIIHPNMKKLVENYFKCPNNNGYPLVMKDRAHFVQQLIADTMMRPMADSFQDRISVFMKELYKLSGWYIINDSPVGAKVEETLWGKGKGCRFVQLECTDDEQKLFEEYCDPTNKTLLNGCDYYYRSPSQCLFLNELEDNTCAYMYPTNTVCDLKDTKNSKDTTPLQVLGKNSKCIEFVDGQRTRFSGCFEASCDDSTKTIKIKIGEKEFIAKYQNNKLENKQEFSFKAPMAERGEVEFLFPESYDRFCFYQNNPQDDKEFKKIKKMFKQKGRKAKK